MNFFCFVLFNLLSWESEWGCLVKKSCFVDRLRGSLNLQCVCGSNGACATKPRIPASSLCDLSSLGLGHSL